MAEKLQDLGNGNADQLNRSSMADGNVQHKTIANVGASMLSRSLGPHVRFEADEIGKHIAQ